MLVRPYLCVVLSILLLSVVGCGGGSSNASLSGGSLDDDPFANNDVTVHSSRTPELPDTSQADVRRTKTHPQKLEQEPLPGNVNNSYGMVSDRTNGRTASTTTSTSSFQSSSSRLTSTPTPAVPARPDHPMVALIGQTAPDLDVTMAGGGQVNLKSHRSSDVLVVAIWASYNHLCKDELQALKTATDRFSGEQVRLLAVNDGEAIERIEEYLKKNKLELEVGMDVQQKVADAFLVRQLPFAVIIDKAGVIQAIHVGYIDTLSKDVLKDLSTIVDGQDIIDESKSRLSKQLSAARR